MSPQRTIVFFDGQNLYHGAKDAWVPAQPLGPSPYAWPSYDVEQLAQVLVAREPGRTLTQIRFYTGVPDPRSGIAREPDPPGGDHAGRGGRGRRSVQPGSGRVRPPVPALIGAGSLRDHRPSAQKVLVVGQFDLSFFFGLRRSTRKSRMVSLPILTRLRYFTGFSLSPGPTILYFTLSLRNRFRRFALAISEPPQ